jgi:probable HAF family extracellular repeat protein
VKTSKLLISFLTWGIIMGLAGSLQAAPRYRYYTTGQGDGSMAVAINDKNQAVVNFDDRAWLWTLSGGFQDLGHLGGGKSYGYGINNLGQIVGESFINSTTSHAFLWQSGQIQDLGALSGGVRSIAASINNLGQVVGVTFYSNDSVSPFIWTLNGALQPLDLDGGIACKIKDDGRMVGQKNNHAWLWNSPGAGQDLGILSGYSYAEATDMNQNGLVVGFAGNNPENDYHPCRAFSWTQSGGLKDLGTPGGPTSRALAVNKSGYISGWADYTPDGHTAGCLWTPSGSAFNLSTLVVNPPGERIGDAIAINAGGVIVGQGNGGGAAYMLVPETADISPLMLLLLE